MRTLRRLVPVILLVVLAADLRAAGPDRYCNPLGVLLADPFIYHQKETYYLYGTSAEDGLLVWTSHDLVDWQLRGYAFHREPGTWARRSFWAPEMFHHGNKYYLHFTAVGGPKHMRRIVLAESDSPLGPFKEAKAPWFDAGVPTIDSDVFRDDDGALYLYSVNLPHAGKSLFEIHVRKLDEKLNVSNEDTFCITPNEPWEGIVNEGPFVMKHNGLYYLTFSTVGFMSPEYGVALATSKSPLGPWKKVPGNPILRRTADVSGPGHHCFIDSPDGKELFIAYHTHQHLDHPGGPRQLAIDRASFVDGANPTIRIEGPTVTPQPMPSGAAPLVRGQSDEFNDSVLDRKRWEVFSEDPRFWKLANGQLIIDTKDGDIFQERSDISNVFLEYAPSGDFEASTKVTIHPEKDYDLAFLILWQNHNQYVKLAVVHSHGGVKLEVGDESSGRYASRLHDAPPGDTHYLKIAKVGDRYDFCESTDGKAWTLLDSEYAMLADLKAGIGACSPEANHSVPAAFDYFHFDATKAMAVPKTPQSPSP